MALDPKGAALALHRFGFGPRPYSIAAIAPDPRGALLAELDRPNARQIANAGLMSSGAANRTALRIQCRAHGQSPAPGKAQGSRQGSGQAGRGGGGHRRCQHG
jgi:uncharacterized protein (DUF1800 family)